MLECESRETGEQTFLEVPRSESAPVRRKGELHSPAADKADRPRSPARRRQLSVAAEGPYGRAASDGLGAASPSPRSLPHQGGGRRDDVLPELPGMGESAGDLQRQAAEAGLRRVLSADSPRQSGGEHAADEAHRPSDPVERPISGHAASDSSARLSSRYFTALDGRNPHPYSGEVPYANASANDNAV